MITIPLEAKGGIVEVLWDRFIPDDFNFYSFLTILFFLKLK